MDNALGGGRTMKITTSELYVIERALESRLEWVENFISEAPQEEKPFLKSALQKIRGVGITLDLRGYNDD